MEGLQFFHKAREDVASGTAVLLAVEVEMGIFAFRSVLFELFGREVFERFGSLCEACPLCFFPVGEGCGTLLFGHHVEACFLGAVGLVVGFGDELVVFGTADGSGDRGNALRKLYFHNGLNVKWLVVAKMRQRCKLFCRNVIPTNTKKLPVADPFESEEFHGGTCADLEQTVVLDLDEVTAFVATEPLGFA